MSITVNDPLFTAGVIVQNTVQPRPTDICVVLLKFPGELLLRMLKCIILPLVVASVVTGLGAINAKSCGRKYLYRATIK